MMAIQFLGLMARVFRYPSAELKDSLSELEAYCMRTDPSQAGKAGLAAREAGGSSVTALEELYTGLFYINPLVSLDVGFQLFGDERKRVEFLLHLKGLQQRYSVDCGAELPDSLPNVLALLAEMEEGEDRDELIELAVAPALTKMVSILDKAGKKTIYLPLLELLLESVKRSRGPVKTGR